MMQSFQWRARSPRGVDSWQLNRRLKEHRTKKLGQPLNPPKIHLAPNQKGGKRSQTKLNPFFCLFPKGAISAIDSLIYMNLYLQGIMWSVPRPKPQFVDTTKVQPAVNREHACRSSIVGVGKDPCFGCLHLVGQSFSASSSSSSSSSSSQNG